MRCVVLAMLLLTACSRQGDPDDATELSGKDAKAARAVEQDVATNGAAAAAAKGLPVSKPPILPVGTRNALPVAFQGYWGVESSDCDLANTSATGRMDIEGDTIRFYESKARVAKAIAGTATRVAVDLAFSGEGGRQVRRTVLSLGAGGTRLLRREQGQATTITYQRC